MAALFTAICALLVSVGAAFYTRSSAQSASNAVALTLSTEVQVSLAKNSNMTHNRWLYKQQSFQTAPEGWSPPGATPGNAYAKPGENDVYIGVAVPISVKNLGSRRAEVILAGDFVIAKGLTLESPFERLSTDRVVLSRTVTLDSGKMQNFVLYKGIKVEDWFSSGKSPDPIEFLFPLSATAGVDSVTQHWHVSVITAIFESDTGNDSLARVVGTPTPVPTLREDHRTYPTRAFGLRHKLRK